MTKEKLPSLLDETGELFTPVGSGVRPGGAGLAGTRTPEVATAGLAGCRPRVLDSFRLDIDGRPARYAELLRDLPAGLSEWAVHPALGNEESQAIDPGWRVRRTNYEFLTSPQAHELLT